MHPCLGALLTGTAGAATLGERLRFFRIFEFFNSKRLSCTLSYTQGGEGRGSDEDMCDMWPPTHHSLTRAAVVSLHHTSVHPSTPSPPNTFPVDLQQHCSCMFLSMPQVTVTQHQIDGGASSSSTAAGAARGRAALPNGRQRTHTHASALYRARASCHQRYE